MLTTAITGPSNMTRQAFAAAVVPVLECHVAAGHSFYVGDNVGFDFMAQRWLHRHAGAGRVTVWHAGDRPRHAFGAGYGSRDPDVVPSGRGVGLEGGHPSDEAARAAMVASADLHVPWTERESALAEARFLVGDRGEVFDYGCDCEPGGERFLVQWTGEPARLCYNVLELRKDPRRPRAAEVAHAVA